MSEKKKRPRVKGQGGELLATSSSKTSKQNLAYKQRHAFIDKMSMLESSKNGIPRYYVWFLGHFEEIPAAQVHIYEVGGFTVVEK